LGVDSSGHGATVVDRDQDDKIISTALTGNDNSNAFQLEPGLGNDMVFDPLDAAVRGRILIRLRAVFADFQIQNRYKLLEDTISWDSDDGELTLRFRYHNLETDNTLDYSTGFKEGT